MLDQENIRTVQERANNIWPTEFSYLLNGWILRFCKGVTWRANSVLPLNYWGKNLQGDITKVEEIYRNFSTSSKFMLHDHHSPPELLPALTDLSYQPVMPTHVMGKKLDDFNLKNSDNDYTFHFFDHRDPKWTSALTRLSPNRSSYKMKIIGEIIDRVTIPQKGFFYSQFDSEIIGVVLAIIDGGYMGVMNLAVEADHRNKGIATSLMEHTIRWGRRSKANFIFLQVERTNTPARQLYRKLGLDDWYTYTYYEKK